MVSAGILFFCVSEGYSYLLLSHGFVSYCVLWDHRLSLSFAS